jgi:hypothetical protein
LLPSERIPIEPPVTRNMVLPRTDLRFTVTLKNTEYVTAYSVDVTLTIPEPHAPPVVKSALVPAIRVGEPQRATFGVIDRVPKGWTTVIIQVEPAPGGFGDLLFYPVLFS